MVVGGCSWLASCCLGGCGWLYLVGSGRGLCGFFLVVGCTWWQSVAVGCDWVWGAVVVGSLL